MKTLLSVNLMVLTAGMEPRLFNLDFQLLADADHDRCVCVVSGNVLFPV